MPFTAKLPHLPPSLWERIDQALTNLDDCMKAAPAHAGQIEPDVIYVERLTLALKEVGAAIQAAQLKNDVIEGRSWPTESQAETWARSLLQLGFDPNLKSKMLANWLRQSNGEGEQLGSDPVFFDLVRSSLADFGNTFRETTRPDPAGTRPAHISEQREQELAGRGESWNVRADNELQFKVGHTINGAAISPDGKTLAVCGSQVITTWDLATGKRKTSLHGHKGWVNSVAFSTDGGMILAGANGPQVKLWCLSTGAEKFVTDEHEQPVVAVAVCPDGKLMASAGGDKTIRLFDTNGKELAILKGHEKTVLGIAFIPSISVELRTGGKLESKSPARHTYTRLASVSEDHSVRIWDLEEYRILVTLKGHDGTVHCVTPSADGSMLATGSADGTVRLWDTALYKEAVVLHGRRAGSIISLSFSPDGKLLAAAEFGKARCIRVWDTKTNKEVALIPGFGDDFRTVLFTPDGKRLIGCVWDGTVREFEPILSWLEGGTKPAIRNEHTESGRATGMIKVLLLSANPIDSPLNIDEEFRAIDQKIRSSEHRDHVDLIKHGAVRLVDIPGLLMRHKPHVVHFSGHGALTGIVLTGADGTGRLVQSDALANIFRALKDNVRVVLLNACDSAPQAEAIVSQIDCAVGMSDEIDDDAAIAFAAAFYEALGYGRSVQTAFDLALVQLTGAGADPSLAKLYKRHGVKSSEIILVNPPRPQ